MFLRKVASALVAITILISYPAQSRTFVDTLGGDYEEAVNLLSDIGIVEGISEDYFDPYSYVTRAEFTSIAMRLLGMIDGFTANEVFEDVPKEHWAFPAISMGYDLGIVKGKSDTKFEPETNISYQESIKILIEMLGYAVQAEGLGGYPAGYTAKASQLGILKGIKLSDNGYILRGEMARLVFNALDVPLFAKTAYGEKSSGYTVLDGTILSQYLRIFKHDGQITANYYTSISGEHRLTKNQILINGEIFDAGDSNITDFLGQNVTVYAKKQDNMDIKTIVSFMVGKTVETLTIDCRRILPATTKNAVYYEKEDISNSYHTSIEKNAVMVYNGKPRLNWKAEDLFFDSGTVKLILNDGHNADVLIVEDYKNYVIDGKNTEYSLIYLKDNDAGRREIEIKEGDLSCKMLFINQDLTLASLSACKEWDIISVAESDDGSIVKIIRSEKFIEGEVTEIGLNEITVSNRTYKVSEALKNDIKLNIKGVFYLNYGGVIVAMKEGDVKTYKYGYIVAAAAREIGIERSSQVKVFTEEGNMEVFTLAKKMKLNDLAVDGSGLFAKGTPYPANIKREIQKLFSGNSVNEQLIIYETNQNGEISKIETAADGSGLSEEDRDKVFSKDGESSSAMFLGHALKSFLAKYMITANTIIFSIPEYYTGDNDALYNIIKPDSLQHSESYKGLEFYDLDECNNVGVLITKSTSADEDVFNSNAVLVTGVGKGMTDDGEICQTIQVIDTTGKEISLFNPDGVEAYFRDYAITDVDMEEEVVIENGARKLKVKLPPEKLNPGDVIKYSLENGRIKSLVVVFRCKTPVVQELANDRGVKKYTSSSNDYYPALYVYSQIRYVSDYSFKFDILTSSGSTLTRVHTIGSAQVLVFDKAKESVTVSDKTSIRKGDMFFASRFNSFERLVVIYR